MKTYLSPNTVWLKPTASIRELDGPSSSSRNNIALRHTFAAQTQTCKASTQACVRSKSGRRPSNRWTQSGQILARRHRHLRHVSGRCTSQRTHCRWSIGMKKTRNMVRCSSKSPTKPNQSLSQPLARVMVWFYEPPPWTVNSSSTNAVNFWSACTT